MLVSALGVRVEAPPLSYQAGRSKLWVKVKNRRHPAMYRVMDALA